MNKPWIRWEAEHDALLRRLWKSHQTIKSFVHQFPGRSCSSLSQRAIALRLGPRAPQVRKHISLTPTDDLIRVELRRGPMDVVELSAKTGMSNRCVTARINRMHERGEVHIHAWERFHVSGYPARIWALGSGRDAKRPAASTGAKKWRRRMAALKNDRPDEYERLMARRRHQSRMRAGTIVRRDPLVAALFGEVTA
ncbi:hypothetical protein [Caballeronia grimmiae]|uniref:Transcriptional regulator n=1 Tax=Caballeronia grimmiae TaxID=1071679 RepID=A0A069PBS2_9BURK|nr:hypothetical protein [Caballeronia grimmiae]KDR34736.1 transcriptional regulator [Caballeronia grimmiae]GGD63231.1 hypothetical protein GCM10010985_16660 [Caballeronia grimmiae]